MHELKKKLQKVLIAMLVRHLFRLYIIFNCWHKHLIYLLRRQKMDNKKDTFRSKVSIFPLFNSYLRKSSVLMLWYVLEPIIYRPGFKILCLSNFDELGLQAQTN